MCSLILCFVPLLLFFSVFSEYAYWSFNLLELDYFPFFFLLLNEFLLHERPLIAFVLYAFIIPS